MSLPPDFQGTTFQGSVSQQAAARGLVASGWALVRAGNSRGAAVQFRSVLAGDPEHVGALIGLAQAQLNLRQLPEADDTIATLLRAAPASAAAHRLHAETCRRRGRLPQALASARRGVALDPREPIGYHILALVQAGQKSPGAALKTVDEGLAIAPNSAVLLAQRAELLLDLRGGRVAEPVAREALRADADSQYGLRVAARIALARGDPNEARELLAPVLRRDANNEAAVSLYMLTHPRRHGMLRALMMFANWRRERPVAGGLVVLVLMLGLVAVGICLAAASRGLTFLLLLMSLIFRFLLIHDKNVYRNEIKAHFKTYGMSKDF